MIKNQLDEIQARISGYHNEQAKADVALLIQMVKHLLKEAGDRYHNRYRLIMPTGINLYTRKHRGAVQWQAELDPGGLFEDYNLSLTSQWARIDVAIDTIMDLVMQFGLIWNPVDRPLLYYKGGDLSPDKARTFINQEANRINFDT